MELSFFIIFFLISLYCMTTKTLAGRHHVVTFNVKSFGARANGATDDTHAFLSAWKAACNSNGHVKLLIPSGTYFLGPIKFKGPCNGVSSFLVQMQGHLKAVTELERYKNGDWVVFGWVEDLTLTGGGTFDGQGAASWPLNQCPKRKDCDVLPTSVKFVNMTNTVVKGITSLNSKFFHIGLLGCKNFKGSEIKIIAPADSPNTDGIHIERSSGVSISRSQIGTGDDCISIGPGNTGVVLTGISCGPGHGISVGSLGRYEDEGDVRGLVVRDCKISGTDNGLRIKTWANSPTSSAASNMTFENIEMSNVANPIIIDQKYCPYTACNTSAPSRVKISDITFKNIRGTSATATAVTLRCSEGLPCKKVSLMDVSLTYVGRESVTATCLNVRAEYTGMQNPPPCK